PEARQAQHERPDEANECHVAFAAAVHVPHPDEGQGNRETSDDQLRHQGAPAEAHAPPPACRAAKRPAVQSEAWPISRAGRTPMRMATTISTSMGHFSRAGTSCMCAQSTSAWRRSGPWYARWMAHR